MFNGESSVVQRWLRPPFALDGWRIDVANMTGRRNDVDLSAYVAHGVRAAAVAARPEALVVAEHAHDARADLRRGGWHGTMAYAGFTRPVWTWLRGDVVPAHLAQDFLGLPFGVPSRAAESMVETMRRFRAGVPWAGVLHSWTILDSHDTARFRTVVGSRERQLVGVGMQMTTPGVPMVFAGDEIGLEGDWGEDARRTMPWSHPETWDTELLDAYRRLVTIRRKSEALARGGIRYVRVSADAVAYLRESTGRDGPLPRRTRPTRAVSSAARRARRSRAHHFVRRRRGDRRRRRSPAHRRACVPRLECRMTQEGRRG